MSNYTKSYFDESNTNHSWYKAYTLIAANSKVLDVGCSSGNFGEVLIKRKNCVVDGIELDKDDVKRAAKKLHRVYRLNVESDSLLRLKDKYDYLYFGDVIEHLFNPLATLKKVKSLLKPNGSIIFSIPNMGHISVRLELLKGNFEYTETGLLDKTHIRFFTLDEVKRVFNESGYAVEKLDYVEKDYPKKLIDQILTKQGLKANNKFYEMAAQPAASAFQFIGEAKANTAIKAKPLKQYGPVDHFETFYNDTVDSYKMQLEQKNKLIEELENRKTLNQKVILRLRKK